MAPIVRRLQKSNWAVAHIVTTGQQSDLLESALADFGLRPDIHIRHRKSAKTPADPGKPARP